MNQVVPVIGLRHLLSREVPPFVLSLTVTQLFYKLGSFAVELLALLGTWFVISALWELATRRRRTRSTLLR